jgi:site-specific DNA recombinase
MCSDVQKRPDGEIEARIAACDRKLAGYRAALDAGGDPATISRWITETTAERTRYAARTRPAKPRASMTRDQVASIVTGLGDILAVLADADPADKAEIYSQLGLRLTYQPGQRIIRAEAHLSQTPHWVFDSVRGGIDPVSPHCSISYNSDIDLWHPGASASEVYAP